MSSRTMNCQLNVAIHTSIRFLVCQVMDVNHCKIVIVLLSNLGIIYMVYDVFIPMSLVYVEIQIISNVVLITLICVASNLFSKLG